MENSKVPLACAGVRSGLEEAVAKPGERLPSLRATQ